VNEPAWSSAHDAMVSGAISADATAGGEKVKSDAGKIGREAMGHADATAGGEKVKSDGRSARPPTPLQRQASDVAAVSDMAATISASTPLPAIAAADKGKMAQGSTRQPVIGATAAVFNKAAAPVAMASAASVPSKNVAGDGSPPRSVSALGEKTTQSTMQHKDSAADGPASPVDGMQAASSPQPDQSAFSADGTAAPSSGDASSIASVAGNRPRPALLVQGDTGDTSAPQLGSTTLVPGLAGPIVAQAAADPAGDNAIPDIDPRHYSRDVTAADAVLPSSGNTGVAATGTINGATPMAEVTGSWQPARMAVDEVTDRLGGRLVTLVSSNEREMVINLHPPELGQLLVRVAVNGHNVSAWFETPQPQAQQAISQAIDQLHSDLGGAGYALTGAWVGSGTGSGGPGNSAPIVPMASRRSAAAVRSAGSRLLGSAAKAATASVNIYV